VVFYTDCASCGDFESIRLQRALSARVRCRCAFRLGRLNEIDFESKFCQQVHAHAHVYVRVRVNYNFNIYNDYPADWTAADCRRW
jgi:hypothetical protein